MSRSENSLLDDSFWHSPPAEYQLAWQAIFVQSREQLDLSALCPICGAQTLHHWYHLHRRELKMIENQRFVGRGGLWEWCSTCGSYEHYSASVPDWWNFEMSVPHNELTALPTALEAARRMREQC
jgi:hypothetical protein